MILEAPPPIISALRSLKKWASKKTISESIQHLHIELLRLDENHSFNASFGCQNVDSLFLPFLVLDVGFVSEGTYK